jgi:DNA-binding NarL/FixJ family response regulator
MVTILIVDDHLLMRRVIKEVLEQEATFTVIGEACNGFEAVEQAAKTQPDVVLMDLDMPGCNGFEATEQVLVCSPRSRVVIFTASHEERHIFQAIHRGAIGYLTKDTDAETLLHAIHCAARNDLCIPGALAGPIIAQLQATWRTQSYSAARYGSTATYAYRTSRRTRTRTARMIPAPAEVVVESNHEEEKITEQPTETSMAEAIESEPASESTQEQPTELLTRPLTERELEILHLMRQGLKNREIALALEIAESTVHKHVQNIFEKVRARNRAEAIYLTNTEEFYDLYPDYSF